MVLKKRYNNIVLRQVIKPVRLIALAVVTLFLTINCVSSSTTTLVPYIDPAQFTSLPFGTHSHWLQPWRAYLETVPATSFLDGIGINFNLINSSENPDLVAQMLAKHGIRRARVEIVWGSISYDDETKILPRKESRYREILLAFKKYHIRPLILLNAHHGAPCPFKLSPVTLTADAHTGDTTIQLSDTSKIKVDYSGLFQLTKESWTAEYLITNISGNTVSLSKPLPKELKAGTSVRVATLKYRPFSVPGSKDYQETMAGWRRYVETVSEFVTDTLETRQSSDKGFDLQIWNELTFGSNFLYINKYYADKPYDYPEKEIWHNLVTETADYLSAHSADFQGVLIANGFANTIPWPASSKQPKRINAISKHPYRGRDYFPQDKQKSFKGKPVNALYQVENKSTFVSPTYSTFFPEFYATALNTETMIRDMAPITSEIHGTQHGRYARITDGQINPVPVWITEVNMNLDKDRPNITAERALAVKAKTTIRYYCFYLNKGVTQVYLFAAEGKDTRWGIVQENFIQYAKQNNNYPANDFDYTSPALITLSRLVNKMSEGIDRNLTNTRQLEVFSISDNHNHYQFKGDGTTKHPHLFNRDVFTFLPFQVNSHKLIIPYYVMTRDVMNDMTPEKFTLEIKGIRGKVASVSAYDSIEDKTVSVNVKNRSDDSLELELTATDYPYLLTIQD